MRLLAVARDSEANAHIVGIITWQDNKLVVTVLRDFSREFLESIKDEIITDSDETVAESMMLLSFKYDGRAFWIRYERVDGINGIPGRAEREAEIKDAVEKGQVTISWVGPENPFSKEATPSRQGGGVGYLFDILRNRRGSGGDANFLSEIQNKSPWSLASMNDDYNNIIMPVMTSDGNDQIVACNVFFDRQFASMPELTEANAGAITDRIAQVAEYLHGKIPGWVRYSNEQVGMINAIACNTMTVLNWYHLGQISAISALKAMDSGMGITQGFLHEYNMNPDINPFEQCAATALVRRYGGNPDTSNLVFCVGSKGEFSTVSDKEFAARIETMVRNGSLFINPIQKAIATDDRVGITLGNTSMTTLSSFYYAGNVCASRIIASKLKLPALSGSALIAITQNLANVSTLETGELRHAIYHEFAHYFNNIMSKSQSTAGKRYAEREDEYYMTNARTYRRTSIPAVLASTNSNIIHPMMNSLDWYSGTRYSIQGTNGMTSRNSELLPTLLGLMSFSPLLMATYESAGMKFAFEQLGTIRANHGGAETVS